MNKLKVFIDTNVWFSFFYGSKNSETVISSFLEGKIDAVISKEVLDELVKNIIQKIPKAQKGLLTFFEAFPPEIVRSPSKIDIYVKSHVDLKDRHIFQACLNAKCDYFVTGNLKDFDVNSIYKKFKIKVLSPKEMVDELTSS